MSNFITDPWTDDGPFVHPTPERNACELCQEIVLPGHEAQQRYLLAHRVCLLRSATGGIGHILDHAHWCTQMHDPDGGRTPYQSALEVDDFIAKYGMDAAIIIPDIP